MERSPRDPNEKILTATTLFKSVMQGLVIFGASFGTYFVFLNQYPDNAPLARTMGLTIIFLANVLLVQVNSSDTEFAIKSFIRLIKDKVMWAISLGTIVGLLVMIYSPLSSFLKLAPLSLSQLIIAVSIAVASVIWYELIKAIKYIKRTKKI
ncbi:MAG TPA: cation-translocating P-type ATPase C-terminal domain-containing protein, partial [Clostridium sp.]